MIGSASLLGGCTIADRFLTRQNSAGPLETIPFPDGQVEYDEDGFPIAPSGGMNDSTLQL